MKFVAYYRVSTQKQQKSGLGISAQETAVKNYINDKGEIVESFYEAETGTNKRKRVEIYKAIEIAKQHKAILVVAKLDRLARSVTFTSALFSSSVDFVCCDNPNANKLTIQLLSVIAEYEADLISKRIVDSLAVKKKRIENGNFLNKNGELMKGCNGTYRLGNPNGWGEYQKMGAIARRKKAEDNQNNIQATEIIINYRTQGLSFRQIVDKLNSLKYKTSKGNYFSVSQVYKLHKRVI